MSKIHSFIHFLNSMNGLGTQGNGSAQRKSMHAQRKHANSYTCAKSNIFMFHTLVPFSAAFKFFWVSIFTYLFILLICNVAKHRYFPLLFLFRLEKRVRIQLDIFTCSFFLQQMLVKVQTGGGAV